MLTNNVMAPEARFRDCPAVHDINAAVADMRRCVLADNREKLFAKVRNEDRPAILQALDTRVAERGLGELRDECVRGVSGAASAKDRNSPSQERLFKLTAADQNLLANWLYWHGTREATGRETAWKLGDLAALFGGQLPQLRRRLDPVRVLYPCPVCDKPADAMLKSLTHAAGGSVLLHCPHCRHAEYFADAAKEHKYLPREECVCDHCQSLRQTAMQTVAPLARDFRLQLKKWLTDPVVAKISLERVGHGTADPRSKCSFFEELARGASVSDAAEIAFAGTHGACGGWDGWPRSWVAQLVQDGCLSLKELPPAPGEDVLAAAVQVLDRQLGKARAEKNTMYPGTFDSMLEDLASDDEARFIPALYGMAALDWANVNFAARFELVPSATEVATARVTPPAPEPVPPAVEVLRPFTFDEAGFLLPLRAVMQRLENTQLCRDLPVLGAAPMTELVDGHVAALRRQLVAVDPGLPEKLDALAKELRHITRIAPMDPSIVNAPRGLVRAYMYWRFCSEIHGRGHVSMTALDRQFHDPLDEALREHPLQATVACPACGKPATLAIARFRGVRDDGSRTSIAGLRCSHCRHVDAADPYSVNLEYRHLPPVLECQCDACATERQRLMAMCQSVSQGLVANLADYVRQRATELMHPGARLTERHSVDTREDIARFREMRRLNRHPQNDVYKRIHDSLPEWTLSGRIEYDHRTQVLIDDLIEAKLIECNVTPDADLADDGAIVAYLVASRLIRDSGRPEANWEGPYERLLHGFRDKDIPGWVEWLVAIDNIGILTHRFYYPLVYKLRDAQYVVNPLVTTPPSSWPAFEPLAPQPDTTPGRDDALFSEQDAIAFLEVRGYTVTKKTRH